jgi:hypothetical protein
LATLVARHPSVEHLLNAAVLGSVVAHVIADRQAHRGEVLQCAADGVRAPRPMTARSCRSRQFDPSPLLPWPSWTPQIIVNAMRAGALLAYPRGFHSDARSCRFSALTRLVFALSAGLMGTASKGAALGVAAGWGCGSPAQDSDRGYGVESRSALKPWCSST